MFKANFSVKIVSSVSQQSSNNNSNNKCAFMKYVQVCIFLVWIEEWHNNKSWVNDEVIFFNDVKKQLASYVLWRINHDDKIVLQFKTDNKAKFENKFIALKIGMGQNDF